MPAIAELALEIWLHRCQFYQRVEPFVILSRVCGLHQISINVIFVGEQARSSGDGRTTLSLTKIDLNVDSDWMVMGEVFPGKVVLHIDLFLPAIDAWCVS